MASGTDIKRGCRFMSSYLDACKLSNCHPPAYMKVRYPNQELDFRVDRLKLNDWHPLLKAVGEDTSLHLIRISSQRSIQTYLGHITTEDKARDLKRVPVLFTRFMMGCLSASLLKCLSMTRALRVLDFHRLPFNESTIKTLSEGLGKNSSLQHISFQHCPLGDDGCKTLCRAINSRPNILTLSLTNCNLTSKGAYHISLLIKNQELARFNESWVHTLRYREVDNSALPGLRRVSLNSNPMIGDEGLKHIVEVAMDDVWMKAFDMQDCGISDAGFNLVHDLVRKNRGIVVFDLRANSVSIDNLEKLFECLLANTMDDPTEEYVWMEERVGDKLSSASSTISGSIKSATSRKTGQKLSKQRENNWKAKVKPLPHSRRAPGSLIDTTLLKTSSQGNLARNSCISVSVGRLQIKRREVLSAQTLNTVEKPSISKAESPMKSFSDISNIHTLRSRRRLLKESMKAKLPQNVCKSSSEIKLEKKDAVVPVRPSRSMDDCGVHHMRMASQQLRNQMWEKVRQKLAEGIGTQESVIGSEPTPGEGPINEKLISKDSGEGSKLSSITQVSVSQQLKESPPPKKSSSVACNQIKTFSNSNSPHPLHLPGKKMSCVTQCHIKSSPNRLISATGPQSLPGKLPQKMLSSVTHCRMEYSRNEMLSATGSQRLPSKSPKKISSMIHHCVESSKKEAATPSSSVHPNNTTLQKKEVAGIVPSKDFVPNGIIPTRERFHQWKSPEPLVAKVEEIFGPILAENCRHHNVSNLLLPQYEEEVSISFQLSHKKCQKGTPVALHGDMSRVLVDGPLKRTSRC